MNTCSKQVVLAVTGASGACYARRFLERASALEGVALHVVLTDTAREIWRHELGCEAPVADAAGSPTGLPAGVTLLDDHRFDAPFCSGSAAADVLVILPCSTSPRWIISAASRTACSDSSREPSLPSRSKQ